MDVATSQAIEEQAEATIRDEIASLLGPAALVAFTVRARRNPDQRELLHVVVLYGATRQEGTTVALNNPAVRDHLDEVLRRSVRDMLADMRVTY